jgi:outer membrane protein assembly factor BamB
VVGLSADGERVYVARADGRLVALDASTGEERWQVPVPGQLDEPPAIAGDRLYIGQRDGRVLALDAATGRVEWSRSPTQPFFIRSAPLVADGLAWAVSEHSLVAYDAESGAVLAESRFDDGANPVGAVATVDHVAFSTGREQRIHDRRNGARSFSYALTGIQFIAAEGSVTVALGGSRLLAVHEDARAHWWERFRRQWSIVSFVGLGPMVPPPPREWMSFAPAEPLAPALGDGRVFAADTGGTVHAYELAGGALTWERTDLGARGAPVLTPDGLVVPVADALVVLDPATGNERTRLTLEEPPHSVIVTEGGTYVAAGAGPAPTAVIAIGR